MNDVRTPGEGDPYSHLSPPPVPEKRDGGLSLEARVAAVESELKAIKQSDKGWLTSAAVILGVVGALVAIPKALVELAGTINREPKTSIIAENPLSVSYEPKGKAIHFESLVILKNDGNAADAIKRATARLVAQNVANAGENYVNSEDIQFTEGSNVIEAPIIQPENPLAVTISLSLNSSPENAVQLLSGSHRLNVTLNSLAKDKNVSYCFNFDQDQATEIVNAKPKRLVTPTCD
jgi:hypothetical protein